MLHLEFLLNFTVLQCKSVLFNYVSILCLEKVTHSFTHSSLTCFTHFFHSLILVALTPKKAPGMGTLLLVNKNNDHTWMVLSQTCTFSREDI